MKKQLVTIVKSITCSVLLFTGACSQAQENITPKSGKIEVPAKGNLTLWEGKHGSFSAIITNPNEKASVELYTVKGSKKKWVTPSLLAKKSITVSVASDGSLYIENFNSDKIILDVKVK